MANLLRRVGVDVPEPVRRFLEGDLDSWLRVEEYQEGDTLVVKAEVPGIDPEQDVDITLTGNQLHIGVRREEKSEHKSKHGYHSEFRYGTFSRTVTLPQASTSTMSRPPTTTECSRYAYPSQKNPVQSHARSPSPAAEQHPKGKSTTKGGTDQLSLTRLPPDTRVRLPAVRTARLGVPGTRLPNWPPRQHQT